MTEEMPFGMDRRQKPRQIRRGAGQTSFRFRLILTIMSITFLTIAGMGYYVYDRARQTNVYLTEQLTTSVRQEAEAILQRVSSEQVDQLDSFFASLKKDVTIYGITTGKILARENQQGTSAYRDAAVSLYRLPNGSWDNPSEDLSSVFIPAREELTAPLISELNALGPLDFIAPVFLSANQNIVAIYFGGLSGETLYYPNIDLSTLVPSDFDVMQRPWFTQAALAGYMDRAAVWSEPYLDAASNGLVITTSYPVYDGTLKFRGVVAMDIQLNRIAEIVSNIRVGDAGRAFLLDNANRLIAMTASSYKDFGITPDAYPLGSQLDAAVLDELISPEFRDIVNKMSVGESGLQTVTINAIENFIIYQPIPEVGYSLAILVPSQELLTGTASASAQIALSTRNTILFGGLLVIALLTLAFLAALTIGNRMVSPLKALTSTADEITRGNLNAEAIVQSRDEFGLLAKTFNSMTSQLRGLIGSLEARVAERTNALLTSTEVSRRLSTILNEKQLTVEVVDQVKNAFNYYHAQIYFFDESGENLVMAGGTGEAGQTMLIQGHKIPKGKGLVGRAAEQNSPVLVPDTTADPDWLPNSLLPETRSEIAVPISLGKQVLGVLDVQHNILNDLTLVDADLLQSIANQVAIAVQNSRSYTLAQQNAEQESLIRSIGEKIQTTGSVEDALQVAARELGRALGTKETRIVLDTTNSLEKNI